MSDNYDLGVVDVTITKSEAKFMSYLFWILLSIFIALLLTVVIIGLIVGFTNLGRTTQGNSGINLQSTVQNFSVNSVLGSSVDGTVFSRNCTFYKDQPSCESDSEYREWKNGMCNCKTPIWGIAGKREAYNIDYNAIGIVGDETNYQLIRRIQTDRLSFPLQGQSSQSLCTKECDNDNNCDGVIAVKNDQGYSCSLVSNVTANNIIPFKPLYDSTLYLKKPKLPKFPKDVFLYENPNLPLRYWLPQNRLIRMKDVKINTATKLEFLPTRSVNDGNLIGVYSSVPYLPIQARELIRTSDPSIFVDDGNEMINLPQFLIQSPQLWVVYFER